MSKTLSTTKDKLVILLNVVDRLPATKVASEVGKHIGFRKAIKKHLKEYTDFESVEVAKFREEQKRYVAKTAKAKEEEKEDLTKSFQKIVEGINENLRIAKENLVTAKVEVVFDNEEFIFEQNIIKDQSAVIFKTVKDTFDAEAAELVFDLFDNAK
jgi:hypothetical protein